MFIELRVPLDAFVTNLRSRLKRLTIPLTDPLPVEGSGVTLTGCGGGPVWLDRIKVWDGTIVTALDATTIEIRQPIDLFVVSEPALTTSGAAAAPPCWARTIEAVFLLSTFIDGDGPRLCMSFDEFRPGTDVSAEVMQMLNLVVGNSDQLAPQCEALDIALLERMFDGDAPPINAVALAVTLPGNRIALRLDFDLTAFDISPIALPATQALQTAQRAAFATGTFLGDDTSKPWTMHVHALILRLAARRQMRAALDAQADTFSLETGPSTSFQLGMNDIGRVEIDFSGEVIDACLCAWDAIDLDVDVHAALKFSLSQPDRIHGRLELSFDLSDIEVACCAITAGFLWLMVGQVWLDQEKMTGEEFGGATVGQIAFGPIAIAIPFMAMAHGQGADQFAPGNDWTKISGNDDDLLVYEREWNAALGDFGFGAMSMTELKGVNSSTTKGLVMSGTLAPARERGDAVLIADPDTEFAVSFDDACGDDPQLEAGWSVTLNSKPGTGSQITTAIKVFAVRIVGGSDPLNQFAPYLTLSGVHVWIDVPLASIKAAYKTAPYSPRLLVVTSGGVRILTVPKLPLWTAQQIAQAKQTNQFWQVTHCKDWSLSDVFWSGGRFNPVWHVDPGPDDKILQFWEIGVLGLDAGAALRVETVAGGVVLHTARATEAGGAMWSGVLASGVAPSIFQLKPGQTAAPPALQAMSAQADPPLRLTAKTLPATFARLKAETAGRLIVRPLRNPKRGIEMRQRALIPEARLDTPWALRGLLATRWQGRPAFVVADANGATLWALDLAGAPRRALRRTVRGLTRAFTWQGRVWLAGASRVVDLRGEALGACCDEAVVDADASGTDLYLLTGRALWHRSAADEPARWLQEARGNALAVHHDTLALADETGVHILPRRGARLSAPLPTAALREVRSLHAVDGPGDSYLAVDASGQSWIVSATGNRVFISAQRPVGQPHQCIARSGVRLAVANLGGHAVQLGRLGRTKRLRRG